MHNELTRRIVLKGAAGIAIGSVTPRFSLADSVPATAIGPGLIAAWPVPTRSRSLSLAGGQWSGPKGHQIASHSYFLS